MAFWGKMVLGRSHSNCKSPEAGTCLESSVINKERSVPAKGVSKKILVDEVIQRSNKSSDTIDLCLLHWARQGVLRGLWTR